MEAIDELGLRALVKTQWTTRTTGKPIYQDLETGVYVCKEPAGDCAAASNTDEDLDRRLEYIDSTSRVLDFGCGTGDFVDAATTKTRTGMGYCVGLDVGDEWPDDEFDIITMFHVLEHIPNPVTTLQMLRARYRRAKFVIEVPSCCDALLRYSPPAFMARAFHDDHIILHSTLTLDKTLCSAGLTAGAIETVHRYGLDNHKKWFPQLDVEDPYVYERMLARSHLFDTIVAVVE